MKFARSRRQAATLLWFAAPLVMLLIHRLFGFSDTVMGYDATKPKPADWQILYNMAMAVLAFLSVPAFIISNALIWNDEQSRRPADSTRSGN